MSDIEDFYPNATPGLNMGSFQMRGPELQLVYTPKGSGDYIQTFQVPGDRTRIRIQMFGAGSGGSRRISEAHYSYSQEAMLAMVYDFTHSVFGPLYRYPPNGTYGLNFQQRPLFPYSMVGCGVWVELILEVTPGEILELVVGYGSGVSGVSPDGGPGGNNLYGDMTVGAGGGSTRIQRQGASFDDAIIILGGGGGKDDGYVGANAFTWPFGNRGFGGGCVGLYYSEAGNSSSGLNATYGDITPAASEGGNPGTTTAAGTGYGDNSTYPSPGASGRYGGRGATGSYFSSGGGGGGGGKFGGGGGGISGSGAGGASWINPAHAGAMTISDYMDGVTVGNGKIVFFI